MNHLTTMAEGKPTNLRKQVILNKEIHSNEVTEVFCNAAICIEFGKPIDLMDVYPVIEDTMYKTGVSRTKPYLTEYCLMGIHQACLNGELDTDKLALTPEMYEAYIPAITKAIALAFPDEDFKGESSYQEFDGYEFYSHQFEYSNKKLYISSEILAKGHGGYFCPDCGEWVGYYYDGQPTEVPRCRCEEPIKPETAIASSPIKEEYTLTF